MHEFWTISTANMAYYIANLHKYGGGEHAIQTFKVVVVAFVVVI